MSCIMLPRLLAVSIFGAAVLHLPAASFTEEPVCEAGERPLSEAECKEYARDAEISKAQLCGISTDGKASSFTDMCSLNPSKVNKQKSQIQCAGAPPGCLRFLLNDKVCVTYKPENLPAPSEDAYLVEQPFNQQVQPVPCKGGLVPTTIEECKQYALTEEANTAPKDFPDHMLCKHRTEGDASAFSDQCTGDGSQQLWPWCHKIQKGCVRVFPNKAEFGLCVLWNTGGDGADGLAWRLISNVCKHEIPDFDAVCVAVTTTQTTTTTITTTETTTITTTETTTITETETTITETGTTTTKTTTETGTTTTETATKTGTTITETGTTTTETGTATETGTTTTETETTTTETGSTTTYTITSTTPPQRIQRDEPPPPPPCPPKHLTLCLASVDSIPTMAKCEPENPCQKFVRRGPLLESKCSKNQCLTVKPAAMIGKHACHKVIFMPCQLTAVHQVWRKLAHPTKGGNLWINPETGAAFNPTAENGGSVEACEQDSFSVASFVSDFGRHEHEGQDEQVA